jgi:hypothetical protein
LQALFDSSLFIDGTEKCKLTSTPNRTENTNVTFTMDNVNMHPSIATKMKISVLTYHLSNVKQNLLKGLFSIYKGRSENIRTFHAPLFPRADIYTHYILVKTTFIHQ